MRQKKQQITDVIGWREWVSFPELGIDFIKVKVDSGARTSAIHAEDIEFIKKGRKKFVRFTLYPLQKDKKTSRLITLPIEDERWIKSSVGHKTHRPVVMVNLKIGEHTFPIELTLVNRDLMGFRMLLGREAIKNKFLLDAGRSFLQGKKKRIKA